MYLLENIIHAYNDDISNVLQEVEKIYLSTGQSKIDYTNELVFGYVKRNIRPWQLLNSLGSKNLKESVSLLESLYHNGLTITPIIISCFNFYKELYKSGIKSIPQYRVEKYALDFAIINGEKKLNVEVDGERYHRNWNGELCRRDQIRNQRMFELGWDVMRFWVYEVRDNLDESINKVNNWLENK